MSMWTQERDAVTGELKGLSPKTKIVVGVIVATAIALVVLWARS